MKNREALFPNRIKFTDEETGKQYVGTWDYADSPTEVGTKLTADVFLSNDNAAEYGIESEDPTPNEVFTVLSKHALRHASDGVDPINPADIGAIPTSQKGSVNGIATLDANGKVTAIQAQSIRVQKTASHTLELSDAGKMIPMNASTALTLTIPTHNSVALPLDTEIEVVQMGTGAVTIAAQSGVTIYSLDGATKIAGRFGVVSLKQVATNYWLLAGALA